MQTSQHTKSLAITFICKKKKQRNQETDILTLPKKAKSLAELI
jgi:hypothetical protein